MPNIDDEKTELANIQPVIAMNDKVLEALEAASGFGTRQVEISSEFLPRA